MIETILITQPLFTHPHAALQPTAVGKAIRTLTDFDGKLFSGYGDWGANTGPIQIVAYDIAMGLLLDEYLMGTQQIARYVKIGNRLYAPGIDGSDEVAYRDIGSPTWTARSNLEFGWPTDPAQVPGFVHCFDVASLDGVGIWLVGITNPDDAIAAYSPDGGTTWDLQPSSRNLDLIGTSASAGFNRFYFAAVYEGQLFVQSPYYSRARVFNPATGTWSTGPNLLPDPCFGSLPLEFAGQLVYCAGSPGVGGRMLAFNGHKVIEAMKAIFSVYYQIADMQVYNGYLYALGLGINRGIIRTSDLVHWESAGMFDPSDAPKCFRIVNDVIYAGDEASRVLTIALPSSFVALN